MFQGGELPRPVQHAQVACAARIAESLQSEIHHLPGIVLAPELEQTQKLDSMLLLDVAQRMSP